MKKISVILSGCGHRDGAEITEAVSLMINLSKTGASIEYFAPNLNFSPVNHLTGEIARPEKRNVLIESARITRGKSKDLILLNPNEFDALIFVGGSGVAKNLSTWSTQGASCEILPDVQKVIESFYKKSKPIGAICISPVLLAKVLGENKVKLTIGNDKETIAEIEKTGAIHVECDVDDCVVDKENKIVTTPAYMYDERPDKIFEGISKFAKEIIKLI
jgi:enhancing lycopene biosynthesis protein 2